MVTVSEILVRRGIHYLILQAALNFNEVMESVTLVSADRTKCNIRQIFFLERWELRARPEPNILLQPGLGQDCIEGSSEMDEHILRFTRATGTFMGKCAISTKSSRFWEISTPSAARWTWIFNRRPSVRSFFLRIMHE